MSTKTRPRSVPEPICVDVPVAADTMGIGETLFRGKILPHIRTVLVGTRVLVPLDELRQWVDTHKVSPSAVPEPTVPGSSDSASTAVASNDRRESATARRLKEKLEKSTRRKSPGSAAEVVDLDQARSGRRS